MKTLKGVIADLAADHNVKDFDWVYEAQEDQYVIHERTRDIYVGEEEEGGYTFSVYDWNVEDGYPVLVAGDTTLDTLREALKEAING